MTFLQVVIMAILQGITEFLPVSSEGHLMIVEHLLNMNTANEMLLVAILHIGTLAAVILVFRNDVLSLMAELKNVLVDIIENSRVLLHNQMKNDVKRYSKVLSNNNRKFVVMVIVSTIPTAIIGLLLRPVIVQLQGSLLATGIGLLITTVFLLVVNFTKQGTKKPLDINYKIALFIGIIQGFTVLPGLSRVGITIATCLLCGFTCKFAVKYSFILSIPTTLGATIVILMTAPKASLTGVEIGYCVVGAIVAAIVGLACVKVAIGTIRKKWLKYFAGYSVVIGIVAMVCHFA